MPVKPDCDSRVAFVVTCQLHYFLFSDLLIETEFAINRTDFAIKTRHTATIAKHAMLTIFVWLCINAVFPPNTYI